MRFFRYSDSAQMWWARLALASLASNNEPSTTQAYKMLESYYFNNGLYDALSEQLRNEAYWSEAMKPYRNPAHRVVEFYVSKLWPGPLQKALPILTENEDIVKTIQQVWEWSNWGSKKQVFSRWFSLFGDSFLRVATQGEPVDRVYLQNIKPEYVTDFDADERDFLSYFRADVPQTRRKKNGETEPYYHTEVWDKDEQLYKKWETRNGPQLRVEQLGDPIEESPFSEFGIDFIPIVHAKFQDIGEPRGIGAFVHALDKIDEANRMVTRMHQLLFRYGKPTMGVFANATDPAGRPLPAPRLANQDSDGDSDLKDDEVFYFPGHSDLKYMVAPIDYGAALAILQDHMAELERDLPEMAYYRLRDMGSDLSGRAVRMLLTDAIDKVTEARGNAEAALVRADQMALTIGQHYGLFSFDGSFEAGSLDHRFAERDIIPLTETEELETVTIGKNAGIPTKTMLRRAGWSDEEIECMEEDQAEERTQNAEMADAYLQQARKNFDRGQDQ